MHSTSNSRQPSSLGHRAILVAMALVVATLTTGLGTGVADAAGTMTITPNTGLIDGQTVHVSASGVEPNRGWLMEQCVANHLIEGCDSSTLTSGPTGASGSFDVDVQVQTILHTPIGTIDCRTSADPCVLGATTSGGPDGAISATLGFDPSGPLLPPPVVHATPDADLIDAQIVAVDGTGFRSSVHYVEIRQCVAGATEVSQCHSKSYSDYSEVGPDGTFHGSIRVHGILATDGGPTVDCRTAPHACELQVGTFYPQVDAVVATISFDPNAPAVPPASLAVAPDADLIDGQTVTVTGAGFLAHSPVGVVECAVSATIGTCSSGAFIYTDASGNLSVPLEVRTRLWAGEILDCRDAAVDCSIQAYSYEDGDQHPVAPISFDPDGPILPPPTLVATPSTDLVDGQVVSLSGTGFTNPYGPIIVSPTFDARHPDVKPYTPDAAPSGWRAPASATRSVTQDAPAEYPLTVVQCVTTEVFDLFGCNPESPGSAGVDDDGNLSGTMQVWAVFTTFGGTQVDCRTSADACSLYTYGFDPLTSGSAAIHFDPNGPLAPPPTITVTPTTGLVDRQELHVVGDGFPANAAIYLHQCKSGLSGLDGCDTDLFGGVTSDEFGHIDMVTTAKQIIGLGTDGNPYSTTFDCGSSPGACRLIFTDYRPVSDWPWVTLTYGSGTAPPASPPTTVVVQPQFTG